MENPVENPLSSIEAAGAEKDSSNETLPLISGDPPVPPEQVQDSPMDLSTVDHLIVSVSDTSHSFSRASRKRTRYMCENIVFYIYLERICYLKHFSFNKLNLIG